MEGWLPEPDSESPTDGGAFAQCSLVRATSTVVFSLQVGAVLAPCVKASVEPGALSEVGGEAGGENDVEWGELAQVQVQVQVAGPEVAEEGAWAEVEVEVEAAVVEVEVCAEEGEQELGQPF